MKAFLLYKNRDLDLKGELAKNVDALTQDLGLKILFDAMAGEDDFVHEVVRKVFFRSLTEPEDILYRQHILTDCIRQEPIAREIYSISVEAAQTVKSVFFGFSRDSPGSILRRSVHLLELLAVLLKRLRRVADEEAEGFESDGFTRFFALVREELSDDYLREVDAKLKELKFSGGVLMSAELGGGTKGKNYILRRPKTKRWFERLPFGNRSSTYSFAIADRDEAGFKAIGEMEGRGLNLVANALAQSTDHILSFFALLRAELAFYIGCLNLRERLTKKGEPTSLPIPVAADEEALLARGLYDPCLSLSMEDRAVGNDLEGDAKRLVVITGPNTGGKSTFLRSVGIAQLMMQCGMFVPAAGLRASIASAVFTHFKREEDSAMESGKLDEELSRMSEVVDGISSRAMLLCNESFASTNEREGSEIARQIVRGLLESGIRVLFVTHMFDLSIGFCRQGSKSSLFLRAGREEDGRRTFKLTEGEPLPTSFGEDLYRRIFGAAHETVNA